MFKFIFVLFFMFLLLLFLLGFSVIRTFKNILFGKGGSTNSRGQKRQTSNHRQQHSSNSRQETTNRKKIISNDEGEYVDYEEVKDSAK